MYMYKARLLTLSRVLEKFQLLTCRQMDFFAFVVTRYRVCSFQINWFSLSSAATPLKVKENCLAISSGKKAMLRPMRTLSLYQKSLPSKSSSSMMNSSRKSPSSCATGT
jgi:hypothetical protein